MLSNNTDRFYHVDCLGSTRYVTGSMGGSVAAQAYDAWGSRSSMAPGSPWHPTDLQFAGAWGYQTEWSSSTEAGLGLQYLQQRYYDSATARFISPDPLGIGGGLNLYAYPTDPVGLIDPSGLAFETPWDGLVVAVDLGFVAWNYLSGAPPHIKGLDNTALVADFAALFIPGGPAGAGRALAWSGRGAAAARSASRGMRPAHQATQVMRAAARSGPPNAHGSRGCPEHREVAETVQELLEGYGWELVSGGKGRERGYRMPWNAKLRFPDLVMKDPTTGRLIAVNVGRVTKDGVPVPREIQAIADLINSTFFDEVTFVPYFK